jgi:hypothetical protein
MKFVVFAFLSLWVAESFALADGVSDLVEQLKNTDEKYEIIGTVCEQAARLDLQREYPSPRFSIETGISYGTNGRTVGELDVIVFDSTKSAVAVAEVKCWKSFSGGLKKARDQRSRFLNNIKGGQALKMWDKNHPSHSSSEFANLKTFYTYSQKGGADAGFDRELPLTLDELMEARRMLLKK